MPEFVAPVQFPEVRKPTQSGVRKAPVSTPFASDQLVGVKKPETSYIPVKPKLDAPSYSPCRVAHIIGKLEDVQSKLAETGNEEIEQHLERMKAIQAEEWEKVQSAVENDQAAGFWGFLQDVASMILSALSTVFGISLVSSGAGTAVGGVMIASGVLGVTNFIMKQTDAWDGIIKQIVKKNEEMRTALKQYLPAALGVMTAACSLAGTTGAVFFSTLNLAEKMSAGVQTAFSIINATAAMTQGVYQAKSSWIQGDLAVLKGEDSLLKITIQEVVSRMNQIVKDQKDACEAVAKLIQADAECNQIINQPV